MMLITITQEKNIVTFIFDNEEEARIYADGMDAVRKLAEEKGYGKKSN